MEVRYDVGNCQATITYGETFASFLRQATIEPTQIILLTNQRYYELFSEKLVQLFDHQQTLDWYICTNDTHCNNLAELEAVLTFFKNFDCKQTSLILGLGNEGVVQLATFLQQTTVLPVKSWLLPLSIRSFSKSLLPTSHIERNNQPVLQVNGFPERIFFDQTLTTDQGEGKLVDFLEFIRCGLVCSHSFLRMLFRNFQTETKLSQQSFSGLLDELIHFYQQSGPQIAAFGTLFAEGFSETPTGHLLSSSMKRLLGCLLHLLWCQKRSNFSFQYKNFVQWLASLGFPVQFPEQFFVSEYVEGVLRCVAKGKCAAVLTDIGVLGFSAEPTAEELLATVVLYNQILEEIRGTENDKL